MMKKTIPLFGSSEADSRVCVAAKAVSALTFAIAACWPLTSEALSLGRVQVISALGEPMQAEIDINEITPDEVSTLRIALASPDTFKTAGLEYNAVLSRALLTLQRRPDGRFFFKLQSDRVVNDPFVDLIVEVNWSAGRIVRDYTLLFDPRNLLSREPVASQLSISQPATNQQASTSQPFNAPSSQTVMPPVSSSGAIRPSVSTVTSSTSQPSAPIKRNPPPAGSNEVKASLKSIPSTGKNTSPGNKLTVKSGDTAGKLAQSQLRPGVTLEQLLASMMRANPEAFIQGNVNRIKAGAVIDTPNADTAAKIEPKDAQQILVASAKDFERYKQRAAQSASIQPTEKAARQSSGQIQTKVEDKARSATNPDKLKLSKAQVQSAATTQKLESLAQSKKTADAQTRTAELNKNIADLTKVATGAGLSSTPANRGTPSNSIAAIPAANTGKLPSSTVQAPTPTAALKPTLTAAVTSTATSPGRATATTLTAGSLPAAQVSPTVTSGATAVTTAASSATVTTATPSATATATTAIASPRPRPAVKQITPVAQPEQSFIDSLIEDPLVPLGAAGGIAALLGGFVLWRRKRSQSGDAAVDSSFLESRLQPDSFFGASGGQQVDTSDDSQVATGSSMIYSPSQLDAAGDVDPVAEAEVYIAYGRDLQAEEILKEALRTQGTRVAIHLKLLEIYAKRRDAKAFQLVAREVYDLTGADASEWQYVCQMGRDLDPSNPTYQPGGKPGDAAIQSIANSSIGSASFAASTIPQQLPPATPSNGPSDIDLDLDLDLFADSPTPEATAPIHVEPTVAIQAAPELASVASVDFDIQAVSDAPEPAPAPPVPTAPSDDPGLTFDLDEFKSPASPAPSPTMPSTADANALSFDLGALSLDLPAHSSSADSDRHASAPQTDDPMDTKLELATEFFALGDVDGARAIAQEVANEASGPAKAKAQKLLSQWI